MSRYKGYETRKNLTEGESDYGIVFYREKRKLHSPPGYECKSESKLLLKHHHVTLQEGSLLKMCFRYISQNINILDSLVGLPEIIGKELFTFMVSRNVLELNSVPVSENEDNEDETIKMICLMTFNEAFGNCLLTSLSMTSLIQPIPYISKLLLCFQDLKKLDLSGNLLYDNALSSFYHLHNLQVLVLNDCGLSNFSIKKITLPYRLYDSNNKTLKILDIEGNKEVTWQSVQNLFIFINLEVLNISRTGVKEKDLSRKQIIDLCYDIKNTIYEYTKPNTEGWAKPLIEDVCKRINESSNPRKKLKSNFYSASTKEKSKVIDKRNNERNILYLVKPQDLQTIEILTEQKNKEEDTITKTKSAINKQNIFEVLDSDEDDIFKLYTR